MRKRGLSEHRRLLEPADGDVHDPGQRLHAPLRILRGAKGRAAAVDYDEPRRVAEACAALGLKFAVITSVNRDDRKDGGAELFALTIRAIRERVPGCGVEVLVPDFQGSHAAMDIVLEARAGCPESQHRNRAAAVPPGSLGRAI